MRKYYFMLANLTTGEIVEWTRLAANATQGRVSFLRFMHKTGTLNKGDNFKLLVRLADPTQQYDKLRAELMAQGMETAL